MVLRQRVRTGELSTNADALLNQLILTSPDTLLRDIGNPVPLLGSVVQRPRKHVLPHSCCC
jgi:hypothetical protein